MHLHIAPNRLICDIKQDFNKEFPFLKLEFFSKKALLNDDYSASQIIKTNPKIGDIQRNITGGFIEIHREMKVKELEKRLKDEFSLAVQVFRRSGKLWLETTMTDNWTLNQQNIHGKELSAETAKVPEAEDFDLKRDADH